MVGNRKALATIGTGPMEPVLKLAAKTFEAYAIKHGYDLHIGGGENDGRPPSWGKVAMCRRLLDDYDEVFWIDSDAIILDGSTDVRETIPEDAWQAFSVDINGLGIWTLCCGVWFLRGDRAKEFLDVLWTQEQHINHRYWEQGAVLELLGYDDDGRDLGPSEWRAGSHFLAHEWGMIARDRLEKARIRHYAARSNEFRCSRMTIDLMYLEGKTFRAWTADQCWQARHVEFRATQSGFARAAAMGIEAVRRRALQVIRRRRHVPLSELRLVQPSENRKALATIGTGPMEPVLELAAQTFRRYADLHGYDLVIGEGESRGRPPSWGKVLLIRDLLDRYDEVLWIDSDAIILDASADISDVVPGSAYIAMARPRNPWPPSLRMLNAGVFSFVASGARPYSTWFGVRNNGSTTARGNSARSWT